MNIWNVAREDYDYLFGCATLENTVEVISVLNLILVASGIVTQLLLLDELS